MIVRDQRGKALSEGDMAAVAGANGELSEGQIMKITGTVSVELNPQAPKQPPMLILFVRIFRTAIETNNGLAVPGVFKIPVAGPDDLLIRQEGK